MSDIVGGLAMSEADEMFKELGYKKVVDNDEICVYDFTDRRDLDLKAIKFVKEHQQIDLYGI